MNCFDILSSETKILGRRFLEASAGTGKTFTIEHLVIRLILEEGLSFDQILVVTFTRAATRQLKMRIRAQLEKNNLHEALLFFDQAQIYTIHGFCQKMLQEHAFEAGLGFNLSEWTEQDKREAIEDFLRTKLHPQKYSPTQIGWVMRKFRQDGKKLMEALLRDNKKSQKERYFDEWYQEFNCKLKTFPFFSVATEFNNIASSYKGVSAEFFSQALFLETLLQKKRAEIEEFDDLLKHKPYFLEKLSPSNKKVRSSPFTPHPGFETLRLEVWPIIKEASCHFKTFSRLLLDWQEEKEKISLEKEKISPDEILKKMKSCLNSPNFVAKVRAKYQAVVVDEFQDTDPIQWEIFETLFLNHDIKAFYLVGDPKQSIYGFRNADIYTYMKAGKRFGKENHAYLSTNYRSTTGLVKALNQLFCKTPWVDLPAWNQTLPTLPLKAVKEGDGGIHFFVVEAHLGRGKRWPTAEVENSYLFPFIAQEIKKRGQNQLQNSLWNQNQVDESADFDQNGVLQLAQTAVLVKDRYQGQRLQKFFQKYNIPSSTLKGSSLSASCALQAMAEIIQALFNPLLIKKALLGVVIGLGVDDLNPEALFTAQEKFSQFREILVEKGFGAFYGALLKSKWKDQSVLEKLVAQADLTLYHDLNIVVEKAITLKDPERLLHHLEELKEWEVEDRLLGESRGIQIMTIHASKGLEFDTVFALGLASRTPEVEDVKEEAVKEIDAEKMRELYVALTRAKTYTYIPIVKDLDNKPVSLGTASPIEIFCERTSPNIFDFPHTQLNQTAFTLKEVFQEENKTLLPPLTPKPFPPAQFLLSFSGISQKTVEKKFPPEGILPVGTETGLVVHRILEKALTSSVDISVEVFDTHLQGWEKELQEIIDKTLQLPILNFPKNQMLQELEFIFPSKDGLVKGFIDLCFEKEGKYYFVDWKTNWLENYSLPSLEKAMHEGDYFLQASIYAEALKRYLRLYDSRPFDECFGGAYYIFVRSPAVYHFFPRGFGGGL